MITDNINSNHYIEIRNILKDADEFVLISPFLQENFDVFFEEITQLGINKIRLITTIKEDVPEVFKKASALKSFKDNVNKYNGLEYSVQINNKLHGKIYVAVKNGIPVKGIITSANFTNMGLKNNYEWGVLIKETEQLTAILKDLDSVSGLPLADETLDKIIAEIASHPDKTKYEKRVKISINLDKYLKHPSVTIDKNKNYFIKPMGSTEEPFPLTMVLNDKNQLIQFSDKPKSVKVGDILICYAVGSTKLLGCFEVCTDYEKTGDDGDRWPWAVNALNLLPEYSKNWTQYTNTISSIQDSFKDGTPLTMNGGKTLGALQWGKDKIRITPEFAKHVISLMNSQPSLKIN